MTNRATPFKTGYLDGLWGVQRHLLKYYGYGRKYQDYCMGFTRGLRNSIDKFELVKKIMEDSGYKVNYSTYVEPLRYSRGQGGIVP